MISNKANHNCKGHKFGIFYVNVLRYFTRRITGWCLRLRTAMFLHHFCLGLAIDGK